MQRLNATTLLLGTAFARVATRRTDRGASLVEYALLITLIAVVCLTAVLFFGSETSRSFSATTDSIANS